MIGVARIEAPERGVAHIQLVHVRARARRQGVAKALVAACTDDAKERGASFVSLEVVATNEAAVATWRRLGFDDRLALDGDADRVRSRSGSNRVPVGTERATTHVQTDDELSVQRAIAQFVPRLEADRRSRRRRAGSASSTPSSTMTVTRTAGSRRSSPSGSVPSRSRSPRKEKSFAFVCTSVAGWSTSTSQFRPTTASCRRATSSRSRRTRPSSPGSPAQTATRFGASIRTAASPADLPADLYEQIAALMGLEG